MTSDPSFWLVANGALLIVAGMVCGLGVPFAPYPRLMLTAHIQLVVNGMLSVLAGLMLKTGFSTVSAWSGTVVVIAHVSAWAVGVSEIAAAFWGAKETLPIAAAQAGAPGATPAQERLVTVAHVIPALLLLVAWTLLVQGIF